MAFKYHIHPENFRELESLLPAKGLPHLTLYDAKVYYAERYMAIQNYLRNLGCKCTVGFVFKSRTNNCIELDEGMGSARPHQFIQMDTVPIGTCVRVVKDIIKQIDLPDWSSSDGDKEYRYRRNQVSDISAPQEKGVYNPFTKKNDPPKESPPIDYSKWQEDDDIPF